MSDVRTLVYGSLLPAFRAPAPPDWIRRALDEGLAGVCLFGPTLQLIEGRVHDVVAKPLRDCAPDLLLALDEEGGDVTRLDYLRGSRFPGNHALGALDDVTVTRAVAGSLGAELRRAGVNLNLAPCADVVVDPRNPIIGLRSFGSDPALVSRHTAAYVEALQDQGIAATAKHFPGHGNTHTDSHHALPTVDDDMESLRRYGLPPFAAAVDAGVRCVMTGHVRLPALDDLPATFSRRLLTDVLRGELGFDGVVVTDAIDMGAVRSRWGLAGSAVMSWRAGADLVVIGADDGEEHCEAIVRAAEAAVADGTLDVARLARAAERVAELRAWVADAKPSSAPDTRLAEAAAPLLIGPAVPALPAPPFVVEFRPTVNEAIGMVPWGMVDSLARIDWLHGHTKVHEEDAESLPGIPAHAPLLVVVRDCADSPWQLRGLRRLLAEHPDAVVVEMGMPGRLDVPAGRLVHTYGIGLANSRATARALAGR
ncbi:glycoside hydrolase family 3 protein [Streptomyces anulatus]|uniref:glycoside hydrolase family 3 protein n=1 Tax=Streptomyces anulatus TaxID=1892 RepID=UPI003866ABA0|nr:glycoside hydrolase family 3 protein [Streptomyces anulatus]